MAGLSLNIIFVSLSAGILPPLLWLCFFWLREDKMRPEPKKIIALVFVLGMIATIPATFAEKYAMHYFASGTFLMIMAGAFIEEAVKFLAAYLGAMWHNKAFDEPIDALIYMITAALGFSAMENVLFFWASTHTGGLLVALVSSANRFIGATMLHTLSSAALGACIGFAFYRSSFIKEKRFILGLILATLLHTMYNELIILNTSGSSQNFMMTFGVMWVGIIIILFFFEKIKSIFITTKVTN